MSNTMITELDKMFTDSPYEYLLYVRNGKPEDNHSELFFEFVSVLMPSDVLHYHKKQYSKIVGDLQATEKIGKVLILHVDDEKKFAIVRISIRELAGF